jgi:hypothetical protein
MDDALVEGCRGVGPSTPSRRKGAVPQLWPHWACHNWLVASDWIVTEITKDTKVSDILREYGDIAEVMEVFGIKRVGSYSVRKFITKALTAERAAKIHRVSPQ